MDAVVRRESEHEVNLSNICPFLLTPHLTSVASLTPEVSAAHMGQQPIFDLNNSHHLPPAMAVVCFSTH